MNGSHFDDDTFCQALLDSSRDDAPAEDAQNRLAFALGLPPVIPTVGGPSAPTPAAPPNATTDASGLGEALSATIQSSAVQTATTGALSSVKAAATVTVTKAAAPTLFSAATKWGAAIVISLGVATGTTTILTGTSSPAPTVALNAPTSPQNTATQQQSATERGANSPIETPQESIPQVAPQVDSPAGTVSVPKSITATPSEPVSTKPLDTSNVATGSAQNNTMAQPISTAEKSITDLSPTPRVQEGASTNTAPAPTAMASSLRAEINQIDRIRGYISSGNGAAALRELNSYSAEFPNGTLRGEVTSLRLEALLLTGDRAQAAAIARSLLSAAPNSPNAPRWRSIAGMSN